MQYRQIRDFNTYLGEKKYSFIFWLFFTIITFGIYHIYHEYKLTRDMYEVITDTGSSFEVGLIAGIISATGAWIFVDLYQQTMLNQAWMKSLEN